MANPYFFGYGSLVNRATHDFPDARPARLHGWRRSWQATTLRKVAFLTVTPDPSCTLHGLIAHVPNDDWDALDQREWAYDRLPASDTVDHDVKRPLDIAVYAVSPEHRSTNPESHPILLSYLDVVVQGYLREFGAEGVTHFFDTTQGWGTPILNDRADPRYPRAQQLSHSERALVDENLIALGVHPVQEAD
jgi:hypothetical protein